jgi:hypothetical protein
MDVGNGKDLESYNDFSNSEEWSIASGLLAFPINYLPCAGENCGLLPSPFVFQYTANLLANSTYKITIGELSITIPVGNVPYYSIKWDSKTGLVMAKTEQGGEFKTIEHSGKSLGYIPLEGTTIGSFKKVVEEGRSEGDLELKIPAFSSRKPYWDKF